MHGREEKIEASEWGELRTWPHSGLGYISGRHAIQRVSWLLCREGWAKAGTVSATLPPGVEGQGRQASGQSLSQADWFLGTWFGRTGALQAGLLAGHVSSLFWAMCGPHRAQWPASCPSGGERLCDKSLLVLGPGYE